MDIDVKAVIKRIELRLAELGMSKKEFYKQSEISSASYSQWNNGINSPSMKKLKNAAKCLNMPFEYLIFGEEWQNNTLLENSKNQAAKEKPAVNQNDELMRELLDIAFQLNASDREQLLRIARGYLTSYEPREAETK